MKNHTTKGPTPKRKIVAKPVSKGTGKVGKHRRGSIGTGRNYGKG